jgi:putative nucleotidyltransferase with HDIG domain
MEKNREYFFNLLKEKFKKIKNSNNLIKHCLACEICMRDLAEYFNEDKEKWGIVGLLHDWDYPETYQNIEKHTLLAEKELSQLGISEEIIKGIKAHNEHVSSQRNSEMEKSIFAVDSTTGLIVASVLVLPNKKISDLTTESILKRMKEKRFAEGANRENIYSCSDLNLELEKFLEICLLAMKKISKELGL